MRTKMGGRRPASVSVVRKRKRAPVEAPAVAQVRPAGENAADRISLIPDAVLGEIVSLLPTKEGARTQVLAKQWRHIWRSAPLNLDCGGLDSGGGKPAQNSRDLDRVVSSILASHRAPARRLRIPKGHSHGVEAWLRSPTLDNLQELEFGFFNYGPEGIMQPPIMQQPPASTFRFAATLRLANFGNCCLSDSIVQGLHFPQLKHLELHLVYVSECSMHRLIAGCPSLECLMIYYIFGFHCLRINSLRLRSIGVRTYHPDKWPHDTLLEKLIIENAPLLERMLRIDLLDGLQVSVISTPKLETLGLANIDDYPSCSGIIKSLQADSSTTVARLVKTLAIHMHILDLDIVIDLIRCFPCLEKLYIKDQYVSQSGPRNLWRRKHRQLIGCLDIHLKTIVLETYEGIVSDVNFATFFVLNMRELELVTFKVATINGKFIARQHRLLQLTKKASIGARFQFMAHRCLRDISDVFHVHDLDLTDPFLC